MYEAEFEAAEYLRANGLQVQLMGLSDIDIVAFREKRDNEEQTSKVKRFQIYQIGGAWHSTTTGQGQSRTVMSMNLELKPVLESVLGFYKLLDRTVIGWNKLQRLIWDLHRAGLWCVVDENGDIEVRATEAEPQLFPEDFMVSAFKHRKSEAKIKISLEGNNWKIMLISENEILQEIDIETHDPKRIEQEILENLKGKLDKALSE